MGDFEYYSARSRKQSVLAFAASAPEAASAHMTVAICYAERAVLAMNRLLQARCEERVGPPAAVGSAVPGT